MLEHMSDEKWDGMTAAERRALVKREGEAMMHLLTMIEAGLAVRRAGLIWFLPLCHDYGNVHQ